MAADNKIEITIKTLKDLQEKYDKLAFKNDKNKDKCDYYVLMVNTIDDIIEDLKEGK
jgi:hypothetical protein